MHADILLAAYPELQPPTDWGIHEDGGLEWNSELPEPTSQQISDWENDVQPLPSGELFSVWQAAQLDAAAKSTKSKLIDDMISFRDAVFLLARVVELLRKRVDGAVWTDAESDEIEAAEAIWQAVKQIREL